MSNKKIIVILSILFSISLVLILWQRFGMNYQHVVALDKNIGIFDDRSNGGQSISWISYSDGKPILKAKIVRSSTFPFSSMTIPLGDSHKRFMDLTKFDEMTIRMDNRTRGFDTTLVYFINEEMRGHRLVERANMATIIPEFGTHTYTIQLENLYTPSWWLYQQHGLSSAKADISNVIRVQVATGDNTIPRDIEFSILHIEFNGKWISTGVLYQIIITMWLLSIFIILLTALYKILKQYNEDRERSRVLEHINSYLMEEKSRYENMAQRDPLTGCLNRHGLQQIIADFLSLKLDGTTPISIIIFDLDHFKHVNDMYGHDEGDVVLKNVAHVVNNSIRESDYLIRWGGEEFLVICNNTTQERAVSLAQKLCRIISQGEMSKRTKITASFGVSSLDIQEFDNSFSKADQYLLKAKTNGRNRVVFE